MNAPSPTASRSRVPSSLTANSTVDRREQPLNAYADTVTTPAGMVIEVNDELSLFSNEYAPIYLRLSGSVVLPRLLSRNAPSPIFSTVLPSAKVSELMLSQLSNMPSGMSLRPVPIVTEVRSPQSLNASSPTSVSVSGSTNCFSPLAPLVSRLEQPSNALAPIFSSEDGSLTRTSPVQSSNARSGISFSESGRLT